MRPALMLVTTMCTTALLYAPQPLLPLFKEQFLLQETTAGLLISLTLAPIGIAPLCYGFFLESVSALKLLRISVLLLSLSGLIFAACHTFPFLLSARVLQGLIIPAVLTSIMTGISIYTPKEKLQRLMSFYIASTITGGVLGRLSAGFFTSFLSWRLFFVLLSAALFLCFIALCRIKDTQEKAAIRPKYKEIGKTLRNSTYRPLFLIVFCSFFVLAAVMNFIPFRVLQINSNASQLLLGTIYTGYIAGIFTAIFASKIIKSFKGEENSIIAGIIIMASSLLVLLTPNISVIFLTLFVLSASMFLIHTVDAYKVNQMADGKKGIVNGLYITSYYAGGTLGSYLPGLIYEKYGWSPFVVLLCCVLAVALLAIFSFKKRSSLTR